MRDDLQNTFWTESRQTDPASGHGITSLATQHLVKETTNLLKKEVQNL